VPRLRPRRRLDDAAGAGGASSHIWRRMEDDLTDALPDSGYVKLRAKHEL
jgi:hypothetical protein